jgi:hypothetical protein
MSYSLFRSSRTISPPVVGSYRAPPLLRLAVHTISHQRPFGPRLQQWASSAGFYRYKIGDMRSPS